MMKDKAIWLLLIFAAVYILGNIGTGSLTTWDEAVYANISRNIIRTGDWLVLHQGVTPWFDKPPLYMWSTAFCYKLFGVNEFSTRFTSALSGVATILLIYLFVKKMSDKNSAVLSALLLMAMPHYLHYSKMGMMDVTLTFFITLMLYLFWLGQERPQYLLWAGMVLIPAYLTKGFAAFLGPIIIVLYCVFSRNIRLLLNRQFVIGMAISFLTIAGWHLTQYFLAGPVAVKNYFGFHVIKRTITALEGHSGGPNFYQKVIFNRNIPWSVIIYASLAYLLWLIVKNKDKRAILIFSWIAAVYVSYTVVKTKLNWYIIPIYPALAVSAGIFLRKLCKDALYIAAIIVILAVMVAQVPMSRAFKLDFAPDVKATAGHAKRLWQEGNDIYITGGDDSELFYIGFAKKLNKDACRALVAQKNKYVYCVITPRSIKESSEEYGFDYEPVYGSDRVALYKLRFKDIK